MNEYELYKDAPIAINFIASDSIIKEVNYNFYIDIISKTDFNYRINEDDVVKKRAFGERN